ncbi:MAG: MFS transporter [Pirellulales bacterium]|nr:MFS transporter [Pirellulales bacterium]
MSSFSDHSPPELRHWQRRIFASVWITYFAFYLCRYNMPVAKIPIGEAFGFDKTGTGQILTVWAILYAIGQFVNGQLADRFGTRRIVTLGIFGSVAMNLAVFGLMFWADPKTANPTLVHAGLMIFWGANGFFQAMGWSPMVRLMAHWFPVEGRGKVMGVLGTCYQFGGAAASLLALFLTGYYVTRFGGDWRATFWVPAVLFALVGFGFLAAARNRPEDVGLPPVGHDDSPRPSHGFREGTLAHNILRTVRNPYLWVVAGTFFMLDVNRYGFVNWLPDYLKDAPGADAAPTFMKYFKDVMKLCIHPLAGSAGAIVAGWATDRFFGGRRAPVIAVLLVLLGCFTFLFPSIDCGNTALVVAVVAMIGFCTYGPHVLMVGHAAQDFGKKSGAAGAAGFIDGMGYIGVAVAGVGAGAMIEAHGYTITFLTFGWAAILGAALVAVIWRVKPAS